MRVRSRGGGICDGGSPGTDDVTPPTVADVDVIVSTHNEERNLPRLLASLALNGFAPAQVIVVDKASSDATRDIARAYGATVRSEGVNASDQRNIGANLGRRPYLAFLDADMELVAGQAREWIALLANARSVVIPEVSVPSDRLGRARALERRHILGDATIESARVFERSLFDEVGGYGVDAYGCEDWVLAERARAIAVPARAPTPLLHHEGRLTPASLFAKYRKYGRGYYTLLTRDRGAFLRHANPARRSVVAGVLREGVRDPMLLSAWIAYRAITYVAGVVGIASAFVESRDR